MTLTDPHRSTVRERLRPVIGDDSALESFMSVLPASEADRPVTEARLDAVLTVRLAELETRLVERFHQSFVNLIGILLAFVTAYMAIVIAAVAALK